MLMQEPQDGLRFRCHAFETNDCYCFSHKKATWYRAEAFWRRFRMTLADLSPDKVTKIIKNKVNDPSAVDEKGEWYWTSATDRFTRGQMIWMNTGRPYVNPVRAEFTSFLQEIEILEDEILTPSESKPEGDALNDALINGTCPKYFTDHKFRCLDINGGCYCIVTDPRNWWSALHYCRQYGMELLSLETKEEEDNLAKNLNTTSDSKQKKAFYLTSGNRIYGNRSSWMWAGTGDIIPLETREMVWEKGEPSLTFGAIQEECLIWVLTFNETLTIHEWNDLSCIFKETVMLMHEPCINRFHPTL
uniref:C-type lectin domain-containing protein n=1 Tax=Daphnia galeata TaxID=27404 RepID=A0A8J2RY51_9CRUS|nr:unnamed protein product [Daphnia galeata]